MTAVAPLERRAARSRVEPAPDGERVAVSLMGDVAAFEIPDGAPAGYDRQRAEIGFVASDVPAYGYRIYTIETASAKAPSAAAPADGRAIDNDFFIPSRRRTTAPLPCATSAAA